MKNNETKNMNAEAEVFEKTVSEEEIASISGGSTGKQLCGFAPYRDERPEDNAEVGCHARLAR